MYHLLATPPLRDKIFSQITPIIRGIKKGCLSPSGTTELIIIKKDGTAIAIRNRSYFLSRQIKNTNLIKIYSTNITAKNSAHTPDTRRISAKKLWKCSNDSVHGKGIIT
jgi:hypothetical protein